MIIGYRNWVAHKGRHHKAALGRSTQLMGVSADGRRNIALKQIVLGSVGRRISWTLICTMILQLLILAVPRPVRAQVTALPSVAILDFGTYPGVRVSAIQSRNATDAVWLEMSRGGGYDITPRSTVVEELSKLDITLPTNNVGLLRLGQSLGVKYIVTGDITDVRFSEAPRRAKATLSIRMTDTASGEFINGAIQIGISQIPVAGATTDDEAMIGQAITAAAFSAVKTIRDYTLPEATVLTNRSNTDIRLNKGGRDGIYPGLEMIVLRGPNKVGRVRVTSVESTDSQAVILDAGKGIRPEDKLTAVFSIPGLTVSKSGEFIKTPIADIESFRPQQKQQKSPVQTIIGVVAAVALGAFVTRTTSSNNGAGIIGVSARAFAEASSITSGDPTAARVEVRWKPAPDVPYNNIIEYHIYRNEDLVGVAPRNQMFFVDSPLRQGTLTYNFVSYAGGGFEPTTGEGTTTGGTTGGTTAGGGNNAGGGGGNGNDPSIPSTLGQKTVIVTPLTVAATHRYRIAVLYKQLQAADLNGNSGGGGGQAGGGGIGGGGQAGGGGIGGGGQAGGGGIGGGGGGQAGGGGIGGGGQNGGGGGQGNTTILYRESNVEASSGGVTPISRPGVTGPSVDQDLRRVTVTFRTVPGGSEYVAEFSSRPDFKNMVRKGPFSAAYLTGLDSRTETFDISTEFRNLRSGDRVYFRVGGRNAGDVPGPVGKDTPNAGDYVYSQNGSAFGKLPTPPPPPSN